jgi:hypothetical protein
MTPILCILAASSADVSNVCAAWPTAANCLPREKYEVVECMGETAPDRKLGGGDFLCIGLIDVNSSIL